MKDYLKQFDLIPDWLDLYSGYVSKNNSQLKVFFNILANNNEIPISHFELIRDIVVKGTPISKCEHQIEQLVNELY